MLKLFYVVVGGILGFLLGGSVGILFGVIIGILFEISIKLTEVIRLLTSLKEIEILKSKPKNGNN